VKIILAFLQTTEFAWVLESFGKLWKLVMQLSRTWEVFERDVFLHGYGKALESCLGNSKIP